MSLIRIGIEWRNGICWIYLPPNQHSSGEWRLIDILLGKNNRRYLPRIGTINNMNQTISYLKCVFCATWTTWTRFSQCFFLTAQRLYDINPNKAIKNICKPWGMLENLKQKKTYTTSKEKKTSPKTIYKTWYGKVRGDNNPAICFAGMFGHFRHGNTWCSSSGGSATGHWCCTTTTKGANHGVWCIFANDIWRMDPYVSHQGWLISHNGYSY